MNKQNVESQSSMLREMVKINKIRFKNQEDDLYRKPTKDVIQRSANFQNFKAVYGDSVGKRPSPKVSENKSLSLHKTKSGSLYRLPKIRNEPQYVETINIELPLHYGSDRAVQLVENKIKPKRAASTVNREVLTENIGKKLNKIEEVDEIETDKSITDVPKKETAETQKQVKAKKETVWKKLPRVAVLKPKKKLGKERDKLMNVLSNINEKLEKMQRKYSKQPKIHYKSVNDCFTQSGHVEVIYENEKYPEKKVSSEKTTCNIEKKNIDDSKEEERIQEMDKIFPEFPKIEDTLREIETHLDNIVNLEVGSGTLKNDSSTMSKGQFDSDYSNYWNGENFSAILEKMEKQYSPIDKTNEILKELDRARDEKLRSIRQQIEVVEDFCDKMSEIANDSDDTDSISSAASYAGSKKEEKEDANKNQSMENKNKENEKMIPTKDPEVVDFMEGPDLQKAIKKSKYLSKEFGNFNTSTYQEYPMVKVFSDNESTILWRKKLMALDSKEKTDFRNAESVTKLINNLKFSLENSLYEPAI